MQFQFSLIFPHLISNLGPFSPVDSAESALGEKRDLLELCAVAGVVVEGILGRRRSQVCETLGRVGAVHLP